MKLFSKYIIGFVTGGLICFIILFHSGSADSEQVKLERPVVSAMTVSPELPNEVTFCGKIYDMTRYNRREGLDRELSSFTYLHSTTMLYIKRANRYFPVIEPILKEYNIPDDFKYLAVIESNLDPRITSPARAVGLWQLLEGTARELGLTITPTVDERCHVEKATVAACKYLRKAYEKYGNWEDVALSYNAGMGRITGELAKQHAGSSLDLWLVEETTRYFYRIVAIKQIFENPYKYGFVLHAGNLFKPVECDEISVSSDILDLAEFAKGHNITYADLRFFNPWLRDRKLQPAGKTFKIKIPKDKEMYYSTPNIKAHNPAWVVR